MSKLKYFIVLCYVFTFAGIAGAVDIDAGPIWNNGDAKTKCPNVCKGKGMTWNGNWVTTVPGKMSVCGCDPATDVNAGPIWNNDDAKKKCPNVCEGKGMTWNGNWVTTVPGKMSVCGCMPKAH
ncbi:MAG: mannan-binding lectin [Caedimonas sp.]|nr:mannan-binding lectin [Caedimonas sp.]